MRETGGTGTRRELAVGTLRYAILSEDAEGCLIAIPDGGPRRGFGTIYEGNRIVAHCLLVLGAPEGGRQRLSFKRRSTVLPRPPADFAAPSPE